MHSHCQEISEIGLWLFLFWRHHEGPVDAIGRPHTRRSDQRKVQKRRRRNSDLTPKFRSRAGLTCTYSTILLYFLISLARTFLRFKLASALRIEREKCMHQAFEFTTCLNARIFWTNPLKMHGCEPVTDNRGFTPQIPSRTTIESFQLYCTFPAAYLYFFTSFSNIGQLSCKKNIGQLVFSTSTLLDEPLFWT
jgi:hypothetical protein